MRLRLEGRNFCDTLAEGCHAKWRGTCTLAQIWEEKPVLRFGKLSAEKESPYLLHMRFGVLKIWSRPSGDCESSYHCTSSDRHFTKWTPLEECHKLSLPFGLFTDWSLLRYYLIPSPPVISFTKWSLLG